MAGDDVYAGPQPLPIIDEDDPFKSMNDTLRGILSALTERDADAMQWDLTGTGVVIQSQHIRFRSATLVFSTSVAAIVTLTIGTRTYIFNTASADTMVLPFIVVIERATDVSLVASAGVLTGYLIGTRE